MLRGNALTNFLMSKTGLKWNVLEKMDLVVGEDIVVCDKGRKWLSILPQDDWYWMIYI